jgi:hypothetical protein
MKSKGFCLALLTLWVLSTAGCALCLGGAVGGAAGYEGHKKGYRLQSPVQQDREGNVEVHSPVTKEKKTVEEPPAE